MLGDYYRIMITGGAGFIGSQLCEEVLNCRKIENFGLDLRCHAPGACKRIPMPVDGG
jgi:nucleoside-diphosphate-sugar epimerase